MIASKLVAFAALLAITAGVAEARETGPWQVGASSYVVRVQPRHLDRPEDRARVLRAIEVSAERLCEGASPRRQREACQTEAFDSAVGATPLLRAAMDKAKLERDGAHLASNR